MNNKRPPTPSTVAPADAAKGAAAELRFQDWLSASEVAFLNIEQTPLRMPAHLRGKFKRADYIVGIRDTGQIAFEVKAKTIYSEGLIFDLEEVRGLRVFSDQMCFKVIFACLDAEGGTEGFWVHLNQLDFARVAVRNGKQTVCCPIERAMPFSMQYSFWEAFIDRQTRG